MSFETIGDFVTLQRGNTYKSSLLGQPGPYLLGLGSIARDGGFRGDKLKTYGGQSDERMLVSPGDLYVSLKDVTQSGDLLGAIARVPSEIKIGRMTQDTVKLVFKKEISKSYIYWLLRTPQYRKYCRSRATGTTNLGLSRDDFFNFHVPSFTLKKKSLVTLLEACESKITLNAQINQTLEQMAQALFKSWFVDFDPVIDNALEAGNPIPAPLAERAVKRQAMWAADNEATPERLPTEMRRLFPDRFEEDEALGWVPAGWQVKPLSQIAHYQNGLALQKFRPSEGEESLPVLKIAQLRAGRTDGIEKSSANIKPECIVDSGDVVFSWSGTLLVDMWSGGKAALNQHLFKVTSEKYPKWFYFLWTLRHLEVFQRIAADKAVTMGHIKRQHLEEAFCLVPDDRLIAKIGESIAHLMDKALNSRLENIELAQLRDTLLPKLLSGELQLPDAEAAVDAALEAETA